MAKLIESITWVDYQDALKAYLGIPASSTVEDANLQAWLNSALVNGDSYMENNFVDDEGLDLPIPEGVILGVYEWIRFTRSFYISGAKPGVSSVKTRDLSEAYGGGVGLDPAHLALSSAIPHWRPYRQCMWR